MQSNRCCSKDFQRGSAAFKNSRTTPSHGENRGSIPLGSAKVFSAIGTLDFYADLPHYGGPAVAARRRAQSADGFAEISGWV